MNVFVSLRGRLLTLALCATGAVLTPSAQASTHVDVGFSIGMPLPRGYAEVRVGHDHYYYHRGVFYRPGNHGYYVVRAPRGAIIRELPPRYARVYVGGSVFYRYDDIWYQSCRGGYVVVDAPPRTVVVAPAAAPAPAPKENDIQSVWVGDTEYQFKDGQFFKQTADGLVWTPAPLGALTKSLPLDARSVWHEDIEYFECDDVYFRKTPDGYKVVEAPWKKEAPQGK